MNEESLLWVTGGRGFVGRRVARAFAARGWTVSGLGRGEWTDHLDWGVQHWLSSSVSDAALDTWLEATGRPDAVFHAAGSGTVAQAVARHREAFADTVTSAFDVIEFLRTKAPEAVLVYPSSCAVYGQATLPTPESAPLAPVSPYGSHKAAVESLLDRASTTFGLRSAIIRFFSIYGSGLTKQIFWDLAQRILQRDEVVTLGGTGLETRDFIHIDDAIELIDVSIRSVASSSPGSPLVVNGGTGRSVSIADIARLVVASMDASTRIEFSGVQRPGDPSHYQADNSRAASLGFRPSRAIEEGVSEYCEWVARTAPA
ncbi:MAG: NAD-dependent epimerase/dehydratase family protein [Actinomycetota bacterium]